MQNFLRINVLLHIYKGTCVVKFPISIAHTNTNTHTVETIRQLPDEGVRSGGGGGDR